MKIYRQLILLLFVLACGALWVHAALDASYYATNSVLAKGRWVKIKVRETGMHQVTDEELRAMGFSNPAAVAVYGYPVSLMNDNCLTSDLPDDLPPVPAVRRGGKLVFYAEGDVSLKASGRGLSGYGDHCEVVDVSRNYFADYGAYFLTDALNGVEPEEIPYKQSEAAAVRTSWGMVHYEEDLYNDAQLGARFLGSGFSGQSRQVYPFSMPGYNASAPVKLYYLLASRLDAVSDVLVEYPGGDIGSVELVDCEPDEYAYSLTAHYATSQPDVADSYTTAIDFSGAASGDGALDFFTVFYPRDNVLDGEPQGMFVFTSVSGDAEIAFDNPGNKVLELWDVTDVAHQRMLATSTGDDGTLRCSSPGVHDITSDSGAAYLIAFDPSAELLPVEYGGEVVCRDLHGLASPDMLIVAADDYLQEAERLAQAHRDVDGIDVEVVLQDDVFNEFSSGVPHAMAIRRLARMFLDRTPGKLKSLLVFGGATYDNRGLSFGDADAFRRAYVPIFECSDMDYVGHRSRSYATDAYFGMLDENVSGTFDIFSEPMNVAVSRIPAQSMSDAIAYVNKAVEYITNPPVSDFCNRALLMCDDGDHLGHMSDANGIADIIAQKAPATTVFKAYNTIYPFKGKRALDLNNHAAVALGKGVAFMGYSGHASLSVFGNESIWSVRLALDTEYSVPPFAMLATCRGVFMDNVVTSVGETMLFKENGGAIAVVGALREVYKEQNQVLNLAVGEQFFGAENGVSMGDVFRVARNHVIEQGKGMSSLNERNKLAINTLCYNMVGDPEIRMRVPTRSVSISRVGGSAVEPGKAVALEPCVPLLVEGTVSDASGEVDTGFNGDVIIGVYDAQKEMPVINIHSSDDATEKNTTVTMDEDQIFEKRAKVTGGTFSTSVYLPVPARRGSSNRFSLFAVSDDAGETGVGVNRDIAIGDLSSDANPDVGLAPCISSMYLDDPSFADGDLVGGSVTVFATVAPNEAGVAGNSTLIGRSLVLTLDGSRTYGGAAGCFIPDENGGGSLSFGISGLDDGRHELTLRVSNYVGQTASRTVRFDVVNDAVNAQLSVEEFPADKQATIGLVHDFPGIPSGRLVIKDASGDVVYTEEDVVFPFRWGLVDCGGTVVPEGVYTVEAYLKGGNRYGYGRKAEVVVSHD